MIIAAPQSLLLQWARLRMPEYGNQDLEPCHAFGVIISNKVAAVIVWHDHVPDYGSVELTIIAENPLWAAPSIVKELMRYPFDALQCQRISVNTARKNKRARQLCERMGFKLEGVIRNGYGKQDMMVYGLLKSEWERHPIGARGNVKKEEID